MKRHLEHLRRQPYHVRRRIAFLTTGALSFLVFSVWWSVFTNDPNREQRLEAERLSKELSPVSVLSNTIAAQTNTFMDAVSAINEVGKKDEDEARGVSPVSAEDVVYPEDVFSPSPSPDRSVGGGSSAGNMLESEPAQKTNTDAKMVMPPPPAIPPIPELPNMGE